ncbi:MAG: hypothetical protein PHI40_04880, partial [Caldisericia bacterium]|nr:hypothetical protein [Caldisericia bacterium]
MQISIPIGFLWVFGIIFNKDLHTYILLEVVVVLFSLTTHRADLLSLTLEQYTTPILTKQLLFDSFSAHFAFLGTL